MKKLLLALLAVMMIFAFCACGDTQEQTGLDGSNNGYASDSDLETVEGEEEGEEEPKYASDGELIVEIELPASDGDLTE